MTAFTRTSYRRLADGDSGAPDADQYWSIAGGSGVSQHLARRLVAQPRPGAVVVRLLERRR